MDDFYRWASLRSSYLADANVDAAEAYAGSGGWRPGSWYGDGWYWDPWFDAYTFLPGDGIFFDPFGWGFYSPWCAPYFGFGYGGWGGAGFPGTAEGTRIRVVLGRITILHPWLRMRGRPAGRLGTHIACGAATRPR